MISSGIRPFIRHGEKKTTLTDLRYGLSPSFPLKYHFEGVYQHSHLIPISDTRLALTAVDIIVGNIKEEIDTLINEFNLASRLDNTEQEKFLLQVKDQVKLNLDAFLKGDPEKISKYNEELNQLLKAHKKTVNAIAFCNEIRDKLLKWHDVILIEETRAQVFSRSFELTPKDYQLAGYPVQKIFSGELIVKGGYCHDFAFAQFNEEEAYPLIFNKSRHREYPLYENPIEYFSKWGYALVPQISRMENDDLIIYCSSLQHPEPNMIRHYGIFKNGKVISKGGYYPDIMYHEIDDVIIGHGNHYLIFRKSFIPQLIETLKSTLEKSKKSVVFTGLGIQSRSIKELNLELSKRNETLLPSSDVVNAGKRFLVRYTMQARQLTSQLRKPPQEVIADEVHAHREDSINQLSGLISKLRI